MILVSVALVAASVIWYQEALAETGILVPSVNLGLFKLNQFFTGQMIP
ncbi:hypothetical protein CCP3SC15_1200004 [Gammaproteobacteria bacterium]